MFNDDIDDLLCLSASQTETLLEEIKTYESTRKTDSLVLQDISNSQNIAGNPSTVIQKTVTETNEVRYNRHVPSNPTSMVFNGCTVNLYYNHPQ